MTDDPPTTCNKPNYDRTPLKIPPSEELPSNIAITARPERHIKVTPQHVRSRNIPTQEGRDLPDTFHLSAQAPLSRALYVKSNLPTSQYHV